MVRAALLVVVAGLLQACSSAQEYVDAYAMKAPSLKSLTVCHGYGCRHITEVSISRESWADIERLFAPEPRDAADERTRIARAVALLEVKIGAAVGTSNDRYAAATFNNSPGQLDCIDETVNTTSYMRLMTAHGLIRHHRIGTAAQRGSITGYVYNDFLTNTAVIVEKNTGAKFAVDSYFYANGRPPVVIPLSVWFDDWRPARDDPNLKPLKPQII